MQQSVTPTEQLVKLTDAQLQDADGIQVVESLLQAGADPLWTCPRVHRTALTRGAESGCEAVTAALMAAALQSVPNVQSREYDMAFLYGCGGVHGPGGLRAMVAAGYQPPPVMNGESLLSLAAQGPCSDTVLFLLDCGIQFSQQCLNQAVASAADAANLASLQALLAAGASVQAAEQLGTSTLAYCMQATLGSVREASIQEAVLFLRQHGARVDTQRGASSIMCQAATHCSLSMLQWLQGELGLPLTAHCTDKQLMHAAISGGRPATIDFLLRSGVRITPQEATAKLHRMPNMCFMWLARDTKPDVCPQVTAQRLLSLGADPRALCSLGTDLIAGLARQSPHSDRTIRYLLMQGVPLCSSSLKASEEYSGRPGVVERVVSIADGVNRRRHLLLHRACARRGKASASA